MTLHTRVLALIFATLLLVVAGAFLFGVNLRADRRTELHRETIQLTQMAALDMDRLLEGSHQLLATLARLSTTRSWDARSCSVVVATANSDFQYDHIAVADRDGHILCASGPTRVGTPMTDRALLDQVLESGTFAVGSYGVGMASDNELIRVGYPVVDASGAITGMVYAGINVSWLNTAISQWQLPSDTTLIVTDRNGVVVARHPHSRDVGRLLPEGLQRFLSETAPGTVETASVDGARRLFGYVPADGTGPHGLAVFVGLNYADTFEKINRTLSIYLVIVLGGLLIAGGGAWVYTRRTLAHPVGLLLSAVSRWRAGDWTARTGGTTGIPEVDRLATAFDEMAATLAVRDDALKYNDSILRAISGSAAELVTADVLDDAIPRLQKTIGEAVDADRVVVLETGTRDITNIYRHVWQRPGLAADLTPAYFAALPAEAIPDLMAWGEPLHRGQVVALSRKEARGHVKTIFVEMGIVSNLQAPIQVDGQFWGQIGIDDCRTDRSWTSAEIDGLRVLADLIGASISRQRRTEKLSNADEVVRNSPAILFRISVVSGLPRMTYVSDNVSLLGYDPAALTADPNLFLSLIHRDDRATTRAALAAAMNGSTAGSFEVRIAAAGGPYRWMENRYTADHDECGRLTEVVGVIMDITKRKEAEQRLQFANTILTTQTETSPDGILVVDKDQRIVLANRRAAEIWRVPPDLMMAGANQPALKSAATLLKDPETFLARVKHLYDHPEEVSNDELETADGRHIDQHSAAMRTPDGQDLGRVWFFRDVTERKQAEEKLQFANTILTTQSETSPDAILVVDTGRRIVSFNRRFSEMWHVPPDALAAKDDAPILAVVTSSMKDPEAFIARVRHLYAHPEEASNDELETSDGRFIDRHTAGLRTPAGRHLGRIWFFRDVTERRKAQQALAESEIRFRTILQATGDGILVIDVLTRRPVLGNQAMGRMLGYGTDELLAIEVDRIHPSAEGLALQQRFERIAAGENFLTSNVRVMRRDGSEFPVDIFASPMRLEGRDYVVAVFHDVSERNRTENALRQERDLSTAIIDSLPGIFFVVNSGGHLLRYNKGLTTATGWSGTELLGKDVMTNIVAEDIALAASKIRETVETGHAEGEIGVKDNSGTLRRYLMTTGQIQLTDGPGILGIGIDVTEARRVEGLLQESEERFRAIFASVSDGILVRDNDTGAILEANQRACEMFGYTRAEILAAVPGAFAGGTAPYSRADALQHFADARTGVSQTFEWHYRAKGGHKFMAEVTLRQVVLGSRKFLLTTIHDITERKRDQERILEMARLDALTGLPNRAVFADAVQQEIARARRGGEIFAVLYIDLDHFKDVNDTLGHPVGDALLKLVAKRLKESVRGTDTVARFGGDEFAILEAEIGDPTDAGVLAENLIQILSAPFVIEGNEVYIGISIGIAIYGPDAPDAESLLSRADVALYRSKSDGRGTYRFFTEAMDTEVRTRVSLGNALRDAIGTPQVYLEYQPQVEAATGRIVGIEALVRWRHPTRGMVSPAEFVPIAERSGLIVALGHWILWEACRQAGKWHAAGIAPAVIAVNISAIQIKTPFELEKDVAAALAQSGLPPGMLEIEITESVLMGASRDHNDILMRLRTAGVRLAIDDFGTGYSSLDYLRQFPMDRIKIAQNFILDLEVSASSAAVVKATIGLARELGIDVIAEGVETEGQLRLVQAWGCREVQGYFFARPMLAAELAPLLVAGRIVPAPRDVRPAA